MLEKEDFVSNVCEASNRIEFEKFIASNVDFVLLDFRFSETNGLELLKLIKERNFGCKVIMLTGIDGAQLIMNVLLAGVNGIVYKLDGYAEILRTIKKILENGNYYSPRVLSIIQANAHRMDMVPPVVLSRPERDLLKAIASGLTTKAIAVSLKMSEATAETYRIRLIKKVGVSNTAGLIAYAFRNGIL